MTDTDTDSPDSTADSAAPPSPPAPAPAATTAKPRRAFSWLSFLAFLFAAGALAIVGWNTYRNRAEAELSQYRLESAVRDESLSLSDLRQQVADLRADARSARSKLAGDISRQHSDLETLRQRLEAVTSVDRSDWELAEVEYLLQLANQRLLVSGDAHGSLELLRSADRVVHRLDDPGLLPVRKALADEIAALQAVPQVDVDGIYLNLGALAGQAAALPLLRPPPQPATAAKTQQPASWSARLRAGLDASLAKLDHLVQIRRRDDPYKPLLAPQYEALLRQLLQLAFEQAQAALLQGNQKLYEASLDKAEHWLNTYFTLDPQATAAITGTIDKLKTRQIRPPVPDISASRRALKTYLDARHNSGGHGAAGNAP